MSIVDDLIGDASVVVVTGPGGVGKTSVSAALGSRAAEVHGRRVLVVTVDPARRLADALGVNGLAGEAVIVPIGSGKGRLWVKMIDMSAEWGRIVDACAPSADAAKSLKNNGLFQSLTSRFVASHDYVALDHLYGLTEDAADSEFSPRPDLIVIDTPPGQHALDILDAPGRLDRFLSSRLLRWLTAGQAGRFGAVTSRPFLAVAERLLGDAFLTSIVEFFTLFAQLRPRLAERLRLIEGQMRVESTRFVTVATPEPSVLDSARRLCAEAADRGITMELVLVNRSHPMVEVAVETAGSDSTRVSIKPGADESDLAKVDDPGLRHALALVSARAEPFTVDFQGRPNVFALPRRSEGVMGLDDLRQLLIDGRQLA